MQEDMGTLIQLINKRQPEGVNKLVEKTLKIANVQSCDGKQTVTLKKHWNDAIDKSVEAPCSAEDKYAPMYEQAPECLRGIAKYYREDFEHLEFPTAEEQAQ